MTSNISWLSQPEDHDYAAAKNYLELVLPGKIPAQLSQALLKSSMSIFKAKDIIRASRLPHLAADNKHVSHDLEKVEKGKPLSPILLVRGDARYGHDLIIADGYHRVCAALHLDENAEIPCKVVDLAFRL